MRAPDFLKRQLAKRTKRKEHAKQKRNNMEQIKIAYRRHLKERENSIKTIEGDYIDTQ